MDTGLARPVVLELGAVPAEPFDSAAASLARTGAEVIRPWLAGALGGLAAKRFGLDEGSAGGGFEERIQEEIERARRFDLQAGLVVVDTVSTSRERHAVLLRPVIDAVRALLRGADRLGRLEDGELAILLVHTDRAGVEVAAARLASRLSQLARRGAVADVVLGCASYPDSGETVQGLVEAAREDRARRLDGAEKKFGGE
jgi:GGDEF domain-containing protein